ncbi:MAG: DUF721 domain-containing protein [Patescibacteria group bacterium]
MKRADSLLGGSIKRAGISEQIIGAQATSNFKKVVVSLLGEQAAFQIKPRHLKQGVLTVSVSSAALASEIRLRKEDVINKINSQLPRAVVKELRLIS